jgi:hypothetical protein
MHTREASARIGDLVLVRVGKLAVVCEVIDHRLAWGNDQFLIRPQAGQGNEWVTDERILRSIPDDAYA